MSQQVEVTKTVMEADVKSLVDGLNAANKVAQNLDGTLVDILTHLTAVEKGMGKVGNDQRQYHNNITNYDLNTAKKTVKSSTGFMASDTGREKLFREYQQAVIDETKEITADISERKRLRKQRADTETQRAANEAARIAKKEDQSTAEFIRTRQMLAEAKLLNAKNGQAGALNRNWKYQTGSMLQGVGDTVRGTGVGGRLAGDILGVAGSALKGPALGASTAVTTLVKAIADLGKAAGQAYSEIEAIKTQLGVVFSNQTQADSMFGEISQYAVKSPFGVEQTSELAVLLKQSGVYATDLMDTLRMIGDTAGGNMEKMKRIANNYAQIVSIGKASMLDMRQFAYAGIPIFEAVSKELGVSQQELRKLISDGKVTSDIIEKVFKDLTGINGIFENATEKGAKTLKARLQNLQDAKQLASGAVGEWGVNLGSAYGGDSFVNDMVTGVENIYQWLKDYVNTVNIENSVEVIKNNQAHIKELEKQIADAEKHGRFAEAEELKNQLEKALGMTDLDKNRSVLNSSYENKYNNYEDLKRRLESSALYANMATMWRELGYSEKNDFSLTDYQTVADMFGLDTLSLVIKELIKATEGLGKITVEETQAHKESNVINAQQLAFDQANKAANKEGSFASGFEKLYSLYTSSDEYKAKKEAEEKAWLEESKKVLKDLLSYKNKEGNIDITKLSYNKLISYLDDDKRVLDSGNKMSIVTGKNYEDRALLTQQYLDVFNKIDTELRNKGAYGARSQLGLANRQIDTNADNETFFKEFARVLDDELSIFDDLIANAKTDKDKTDYTNMRKALLASTFKYEAPSEEGLLADLTQKGKEKPDFIPLWKRIIASATGWSAENITTSKQFMKEYQKYSAQQIARGGIQGLANVGMRAGEIGTMLSYTGTVNKQGVRQVDWEKTEQNIYKYALALETPLKRSSAAMNGLADAMKSQVETYRKLTADIYTVGEDWTTINNDIKGQYSVAQGLGNANILDNAFEAFAKESDNFKVQFDEKQGLVVFDKLSNTIVGSVAELKANSDIKDENLKKYMENIKVDNLVTALDEATRQIEINSQITQVEAEALNEATKLEAKRLESRVNTYGQSGAVLGALKGSRNDDIAAWALGLTARNDSSVGYKAGKDVNDAVTNILKKISEMDNIQLSSDKYLQSFFKEEDFRKRTALDSIRDALNEPNVERFEDALSEFISAFPEVVTRILEEATRTEDEIKNDEYTAAADKALRELPLSISDAFRNNVSITGNMPFGQNVVEALGSPLLKFETLLDDMTKAVKANPSDNGLLIDKYASNMISAVKKEGRNGDLSPEKVEEYSREISRLANDGDLERLEEYVAKIGDGKMWENATRGANKWALSLGNIGNALENISQDTKKLAEDFTSDAITSTFTTWGETLGKGEDASEALSKNFAQMSASMLQNMGSMITQAGLSLAISSVGDKAGVLAGLAIAAAGGGLSFLGGYINGALSEDDKNKKDNEYEKLLKIKQDLADLLKQAREDAIYYENTVRHKKAISANDALTAKSVHDAIITPQGQVVTTDPKDYLIATKTPKSLVGGGAPTINFSVIDKSTGIKVTQQKSTYNESTNTIEFEAIIESKIQEVIASSKGDEAFAARQARLNGRTVIA